MRRTPETMDRLAHPEDFLIFVSSVLQLVVLVIAFVAGATAVTKRRNW